MRGLERHPHNPDAHDQLARIYVDDGNMQSAFDEWDVVLRLAPGHVGAMKGMAFILFQQGKLDEAERLLVQAQSAGEDVDLAAALARIRRSGGVSRVSMPTTLPDDPRLLFSEILAVDQAGILLDRDGLVLAGAYYADGRDVAGEIGATLTGVSGEASRAMRHLDMGAWRSIVFETEAAVVTLAPAPADSSAAGGLVVLTAPPTAPLGLLKRLLERCLDRALVWGSAGGSAS
jgi:predicted regulator of Ras-like GTPase activity (Roadblock/LC7/MglB family)